jgi:NAD(P)-dependent dehydrogenase (short-subunit alcohol dehydrogenase family)
MDLGLSGKHVLITGGSKGIGLACARLFLAEGCGLSLVSREQAHLDEAKHKLAAEFSDAEDRVAVYSADLRDAAAAAQVIADAERDGGPIDILVNSAGAAKRTPPDELSPERWRDAMDAKYFSYINVIDPLIKRMAARGAGAIVNIVGMGGKIASATHIAGGAANSALMLATAGLASAYGPKGVRVNAINPGLTLTDRLNEGLKAEARMKGITLEEALKEASSGLPLGRIAAPKEIASAVVFLASPRASYISGAIIAMDGARSPIV